MKSGLVCESKSAFRLVVGKSHRRLIVFLEEVAAQSDLMRDEMDRLSSDQNAASVKLKENFHQSRAVRAEVRNFRRYLEEHSRIYGKVKHEVEMSSTNWTVQRRKSCASKDLGARGEIKRAVL